MTLAVAQQAPYALTISGTAPVDANGATSVIGTTAPVLGLYDYVTVTITAAGNTGGQLDVYIQCSPDSRTWIDWAHPTHWNAAAAAKTWVLGVSRAALALTSLTVAGTGLSPALADNTFLATDWGQALRVVAVSGVGTTVGGAISVVISASARVAYAAS